MSQLQREVEALLSSSGLRPGTLLNILQHKGQSSQGITQPQMSSCVITFMRSAGEETACCLPKSFLHFFFSNRIFGCAQDGPVKDDVSQTPLQLQQFI